MQKKLLASLIAAATLTVAALPVQAADTIRIAFNDPLSGPFAATGINGLHEFEFAVEEINKKGGVLGKKLEVIGFDNKVSPEQALIQLKNIIGEGIQFVFQGNSSGVANAITDAVAKHNERNPKERILYLNYSAVDPALTNEKCNFWHFRFDPHADMKMNALTDVLAQNKDLKRVYVIGQDYSFGKAVAAAADKYLKAKRPDITIVGSELHPIGKVKDFSPYIAKIKAADAQAVITGNWGADMLGLAKAAEDANLGLPIYTYYAATTGITKAIGAGGVGKVRLVHEGALNPPLTDEWSDYITRFKAAYPDGDIAQSRVNTSVNMLVKAIEKAGSTDVVKVAMALEGQEYTSPWGDKMTMRADDHQIQSPIRISVHTDKDIKHDYDNSGFGIRTEATVTAEKATVPTSCKMERPAS